MTANLEPSDRDPQHVLSPAEAKAEQLERDYTLCRNALMRGMSNTVRGYRTCPVRACRRARRCCGETTHACFETMRRIPLSYDQQVVAIEDIHQTILRRRRESKQRKVER